MNASISSIEFNTILLCLTHNTQAMYYLKFYAPKVVSVFPCGIEHDISYQYFSKYCIEVRNISFMATLSCTPREHVKKCIFKFGFSKRG